MTQETAPMPFENEIERELFKGVEKSILGHSPYIPNPIERLGAIFNWYPEQFTLIGSNTGVGKTSYVDHNVLAMIDYIEANPEAFKDIHVEFVYYSMERKKKIKYAKWLSWKLFVEENKRIESKTIMNKDNTLNIKQLNYIRKKYGDWLTGVLQYVDLREGARSVEQIRVDMESKARSLGSFYHSDDTSIYKFGEFVKEFDKSKFVTSKYGKRYYTHINIGGTKYTLYSNDKLYVAKKPSLVFWIFDHVGKFVVGPGGKKLTLDAISEVLSEGRDNYLFSPIAISQFNRGISATDRLKFNQGDLDPVLEDFKDTGNMTESADLVLSIFDPARYKSWDVNGNYKGYNIRDSTVTMQGKQRSRSIHILKHSEGISGLAQVLRFTGEAMHFSAMPPIDDEEGLKKVYMEIMKGK